MTHKTCCGCRKDFALESYWRKKSNRDGHDDFCPNCKRNQQIARENTPKGIYELKARLLATIFKPQWFPGINKEIYQLDHKFSLAAGFQCQVPLEIIANKNNICPLTIRDNRVKGTKCSISLDQLFSQADSGNNHFRRMTEIVNKQNNPDILRRWAKYVYGK